MTLPFRGLNRWLTLQDVAERVTGMSGVESRPSYIGIRDVIGAREGPILLILNIVEFVCFYRKS